MPVYSVSFDFSVPYFRYRYLVLAFTMVVMGSCTCLMPYAPSLLGMYVISFISGIASGALDTGALVSVQYGTVTTMPVLSDTYPGGGGGALRTKNYMLRIPD